MNLVAQEFNVHWSDLHVLYNQHLVGDCSDNNKTKQDKITKPITCNTTNTSNAVIYLKVLHAQ